MTALAVALVVAECVLLLVDRSAQGGVWDLVQVGVLAIVLGVAWINLSSSLVLTAFTLAISVWVGDHVVVALLLPALVGLAMAFLTPRQLALVGVGVGAWAAGVPLARTTDWLLVLVILVVCLPAAWVALILRDQHGVALARDQALKDALEAKTQALLRVRSAIALDLHDVLAHRLSIISLHAQAYRLSRDVAELRETLGTLGAEAREAMVDLRIILDSLLPNRAGVGDGGEAVVHLDLTEGIPAVARTLESLGHPVSVEVDDGLAGLPARHAATLMRVLQEATTNILKHSGGGGCDITVTLTDERVTLRVANKTSTTTSSPSTTGYGLLNMSERVSVLGGGCVAGPVEEGWKVEAWLPLRHRAESGGGQDGRSVATVRTVPLTASTTGQMSTSQEA